MICWLTILLLLHSRDAFGHSPLHLAAYYGFVSGVEMLAGELEADVNAHDNLGRTSLHLAAYAGHPLCLGELLHNHAAVDSIDHQSRTPLDFAALSGREECVEKLLNKSADVECRDDTVTAVVLRKRTH